MKDKRSNNFTDSEKIHSFELKKDIIILGYNEIYSRSNKIKKWKEVANGYYQQ